MSVDLSEPYLAPSVARRGAPRRGMQRRAVEFDEAMESFDFCGDGGFRRGWPQDLSLPMWPAAAAFVPTPGPHTHTRAALPSSVARGAGEGGSPATAR